MVIGLALAALSGCDASPKAMGFQDSTGGVGDQRGDVDAAASGGAGGGAAGMSGSGGAAAAGGRSGAGGAFNAAGGTAGALGSAGGAGGTGSGGAGASYLPCQVYSWSPNGGTSCVKQTSPGVFVNGYKDGHQCGICANPSRPAGVPDCQDPAGPGICVVSCDECTFQ